ncbi:MAG: pseudouridine synthase [Acidimicrobiia bacterium]
MARTGYASRRKADVLLAQGRITVNGEVAAVGDRIELDDVVAIDGVRLPLDPDLVTWLVYKPPGVVSTMDDPQDRPTVTSLVPAEPVTKPVGRLDLHSEGLLLMTNDGDLALVVTHPRYGIPKTYQALVTGNVASAQLNELTTGIELDDGLAAAVSARIVDSQAGKSIVEIVMAEGRKREVRRMLDAVDLNVQRLVRTAIGPIVDRTLKPGAYRPLTFDEIMDLYRMADKQPPSS